MKKNSVLVTTGSNSSSPWQWQKLHYPSVKHLTARKEPAHWNPQPISGRAEHKSAATLQSKCHFEHTVPPHTVPHSPFINDAICPDLETFCTGCRHIKMSRDRLSKIMSHNFSKINYDESGHFCELLRSSVHISDPCAWSWSRHSSGLLLFFFSDSPILTVNWVYLETTLLTKIEKFRFS